jgi:hypothetical protein
MTSRFKMAAANVFSKQEQLQQLVNLDGTFLIDVIDVSRLTGDSVPVSAASL